VRQRCLRPLGAAESERHTSDLATFGPGGDQVPAAYWDEAQLSQWGQSHPVHTEIGMPESTIPLNLHADGVETFNDIEFHVFSHGQARWYIMVSETSL
jgi:hypothetical protein